MRRPGPRGLGSLLLAVIVAGDDTEQALLGVQPSIWASYRAGGDKYICDEGQRSIPLSQLNDDYCDCNDGSDEPGTSACHNGQFWCMNQRHRGRYIRSSLVNDHVCDCCDGSDEYSSGAECTNTCAAEGEVARAAAAERLRVVKDGLTQARAWSAEALASKKLWEDGAEEARRALVKKREAAAVVEERKRAAEEVEEKVREEMRQKKAAEDEAKRKEEEAERALNPPIESAVPSPVAKADCPSKDDVMATAAEERWAAWDDPGCSAGCYDPQPGEERPHCWKRKPIAQTLDPGDAETAMSPDEDALAAEGVDVPAQELNEPEVGYNDPADSDADFSPSPAQTETESDTKGDGYGEDIAYEEKEYMLPDDFDPDKPHMGEDYSDTEDNHDDEDPRFAQEDDDTEADADGDGGSIGDEFEGVDSDAPYAAADDSNIPGDPPLYSDPGKGASEASIWGWFEIQFKRLRRGVLRALAFVKGGRGKARGKSADWARDAYTHPEAERLREEFGAIQKEVNELQSKLTDFENKLSADYGPEMRVLHAMHHLPCRPWCSTLLLRPTVVLAAPAVRSSEPAVF